MRSQHNRYDRMKQEKALKIFALVANAIMLLLHFRLVFIFSGEQVGDAPEYISLAIRVVEKTGFYPIASDFVGVRYIHNPGMVNYLALLFRITRDLRLVFLLNVLFAQIILFSSRYILWKITESRRAQYLYQVFFCIYFSLGVAGGIVSAGVEYVFTSLTLLAAALILTEKRILWPIAGLILAIANYVRPVFAFAVIPIIITVVCLKIKGKYIRIGCFLGGMVAAVLLLSGINYRYCGKPIYQATTMWSVFIVGNNPIADGNNTWDVFNEGNIAYVSPEESEGWTCDDFDAHNKELVIDWVKHNPEKVLLLIPKRLFYFWAADTYFISAYSNNTEPADKSEYMLDIIHKVTGFNIGALTPTQWVCVVSQGIYCLILALGLVSLIAQILRKSFKGYLGLYAFLLLANGAYALTYGCARYHFMYMVIIIMLIPEFFCYNNKRVSVYGEH